MIRAQSRERPSSGKPGGERTDVEQELVRLQREYRYMEVDRKSYGELSQNLIRKQRATIERWKKENEHIKKELTQIESRQQAAETDQVLTKKLQELHEKSDHFQTLADKEEATIAELQKQIDLMRDRTKELKSERKKMGYSVNMDVENNHVVQKQIRVLENRLDKALVKFNQALSHNKKLRESIDNLRRERVFFDGIYKKLEKELIDRKRKMAKIIEKSNADYDSRDLNQDAMNKLKEQHIKDMSSLETEMMEWNRRLKFDRRVKNFIGIKETDRQGAHQGKEKSSKARGWTGKNKSNADVVSEKVQTYEEAFDKINAATGITDTDELVSTFIEVEDQNFSLFNFVNDLQNEIEKLEENIQDLKTEIESAKHDGESADNDRKEMLNTLKNRLAKTEARSEQYEAKAAAATAVVEDLKTAIQAIFTNIGCSSHSSPLSDMLGEGGVTESNMMQYLGVVEQRANDILLAHSAHTAKQEDTEAPSSRPAARRAPETTSLFGSHQRRITIAPPSTYIDGGDHDDDGSDSSDEGSHRPLTREELKSKTIKGITRKQEMERTAKKRAGPKKRRGH